MLCMRGFEGSAAALGIRLIVLLQRIGPVMAHLRRPLMSAVRPLSEANRT
jgi:hypothetical protein